MQFEVVKLEIYGPIEIMEDLRNQLSALGAAHVGNYHNVSSYHTIQGTWKPIQGATPYQGDIDFYNTDKK